MSESFEGFSKWVFWRESNFNYFLLSISFKVLQTRGNEVLRRGRNEQRESQRFVQRKIVQRWNERLLEHPNRKPKQENWKFSFIRNIAHFSDMPLRILEQHFVLSLQTRLISVCVVKRFGSDGNENGGYFCLWKKKCEMFFPRCERGTTFCNRVMQNASVALSLAFATFPETSDNSNIAN